MKEKCRVKNRKEQKFETENCFKTFFKIIGRLNKLHQFLNFIPKYTDDKNIKHFINTEENLKSAKNFW